jgi:2,4-dienoyl-CoA reductase-like NADH-dependent reductase (Old Yellow Enzyme family)
MEIPATRTSPLFQPLRLNRLQIKNRLVRSATHEGMADKGGFPTAPLFKLYGRLARGGAGLLVTGFASVAEDGIGHLQGMNGIHTDAHIAAYRDLTAHVHDTGTAIAMQIAHAGRQTTEAVIGTRPMAPSAVRDTALFVRPRAMSGDDIARVIEAFGQAARRVRASGFDAVQLHAAHGYLLSSFLCPHTNRRRDRWGGSVDNRMRIIRHIYRRCRELVGEDYPLLIKINATDTLKRGLPLEESLAMARQMAAMGFDGIEVSCGIGEDGGSTIRGDLPVDVVLDHWPMYRRKNPLFKFVMRRWAHAIKPPVPFSENYNLASARAVKQAVDVPVIAVGGFIRPAAMAAALRDGAVDGIALCRPLIADPAFPAKIAKGDETVSRCVQCNLCLFYGTTAPLRCYHGQRMDPSRNRPQR